MHEQKPQETKDPTIVAQLAALNQHVANRGSGTDPRTAASHAEADEANARSGEAHKRVRAPERLREQLQAARASCGLMDRSRPLSIIQTHLDEALLWLGEIEQPRLDAT